MIPSSRDRSEFHHFVREDLLEVIASFADLATRNFTTDLALILIASPVCGFRPRRAFLSDFTSRPKPGITNEPCFLVSPMAVSARRSSNPAVRLLLRSSASAICRTRAVLVSGALCPVDVGIRRAGTACVQSDVVHVVSEEPPRLFSESAAR